MESVSRITIFCLKMTVKSGLEIFILKFLYSMNYFLLLHKREDFTNSVKKWTFFRMGDLEMKISWPLFTLIFRPKITSHSAYVATSTKSDRVMIGFFIQSLCRFQKCKQIVPPLSLLSNEKSPFTPQRMRKTAISGLL